jgi:hypothetical protein
VSSRCTPTGTRLPDALVRIVPGGFEAAGDRWESITNAPPTESAGESGQSESESEG